jgi:hypothetical protein
MHTIPDFTAAHSHLLRLRAGPDCQMYLLDGYQHVVRLAACEQDVALGACSARRLASVPPSRATGGQRNATLASTEGPHSFEVRRPEWLAKLTDDQVVAADAALHGAANPLRQRRHDICNSRENGSTARPTGDAITQPP